MIKKAQQVDNEVHLMWAMSLGSAQSREVIFINIQQKIKLHACKKGILYLHFKGWPKDAQLHWQNGLHYWFPNGKSCQMIVNSSPFWHHRNLVSRESQRFPKYSFLLVDWVMLLGWQILLHYCMPFEKMNKMSINSASFWNYQNFSLRKSFRFHKYYPMQIDWRYVIHIKRWIMP